jgi:Na+-driven multidrug efflux pump
MTMQTITGIITSLSMGCTVLLGQNIGKKDYKAASKTIASALALYIVIALVLTVGIIALTNWITAIMNAPLETSTPTQGYICICGFGICLSSYLMPSAEFFAD